MRRSVSSVATLETPDVTSLGMDFLLLVWFHHNGNLSAQFRQIPFNGSRRCGAA
jgi:hypothetical protein